MKKHSGFTLVELLVTLAIVGILARVAFASFDYSRGKNRMMNELSEFVISMQYARYEAMREGVPVSVCASADGATCASNTTNWNQGWIVFSDLNGNGAVGTGDLLYRVEPAFKGTDTFTINSSRSFTFSRLGLLLNGNPSATTPKLTVANASVNSAANQCVSITFLGTMTTASGSSC